MKNLNKADFYFGAFYSYLITKAFNPVLIDQADSSRQLSISTNNKDYNLFAMYISKPTNSTSDGTKIRWDFLFTSNLVSLLTRSICNEKENYVVFICGQENFKDSEIIVVPYKEAQMCLGKDNINSNRRISITVSKHENYAYCYGTAVDKKNSLRVKRNIEEYFK